MEQVVQRVDRLEILMAQLLETTAQTSRELREFKEEMRAAAERSEARSQREMSAFKQEMLEFKDEMRDFKDEMLEFKDEMREFKDEMRDFKDEMGEFKNETLAFRKETREAHRQLQQQIGEAANKTGRLVEDLVAPGIPKIFREVTGLSANDIEFHAVRVKIKHPNAREFDVVIMSSNYVLINETKSTLNPEQVNNFHSLMQTRIREYFPESADKQFIGIVSSLYVDASIVALGSRLGLFVLGFGEDLLDVLNPTDFKPSYF